MLRGALIGFGKIAGTGHVPALKDERIRSRLEVTAVVDPDENAWEKARQMFPGVHCYPSVADLLQNEEIDFADICSPPVFHGEAIRACAGRGIHMLCEKPLAAIPAEVRALEKTLADRPDLVFVPCHQYRYSPVWKQFKSFIEQNGDQSRFLLQCSVFRTNPDQGYFAANAGWRTDRAVSGGGILADTGVHYISLCLWLLGAPVKLQASVLRLNHRQLAVEDTAVVWFECQSGVMEVVLTWGADRRANSARIVSAGGSLSYDGRVLEKASPSGTEIVPVPDAADKSTYVGMYVSLFEEFCDRVENRSGSGPWLAEAVRSAKILHMCYESSASGRAIETGW